MRWFRRWRFSDSRKGEEMLLWYEDKMPGDISRVKHEGWEFWDQVDG